MCPAGDAFKELLPAPVVSGLAALSTLGDVTGLYNKLFSLSFPPDYFLSFPFFPFGDLPLSAATATASTSSIAGVGAVGIGDIGDIG